MDGWMDGYFCAADTRISFSLAAPSADHHIRLRIITTLPMRDHSSFVIEGAACNTQEQGTRILFLYHSFKPTYGDYCGDGADDEHRTREHPHHQANGARQPRNQDPSTSSCSGGGGDRDDRCMVRVFPSIRERVYQHQSSLALARRKHTH